MRRRAPQHSFWGPYTYVSQFDRKIDLIRNDTNSRHVTITEADLPESANMIDVLSMLSTGRTPAHINICDGLSCAEYHTRVGIDHAIMVAAYYQDVGGIPVKILHKDNITSPSYIKVVTSIKYSDNIALEVAFNTRFGHGIYKWMHDWAGLSRAEMEKKTVYIINNRLDGLVAGPLKKEIEKMHVEHLIGSIHE